MPGSGAGMSARGVAELLAEQLRAATGYGVAVVDGADAGGESGAADMPGPVNAAEAAHPGPGLGPTTGPRPTGRAAAGAGGGDIHLRAVGPTETWPGAPGEDPGAEGYLLDVGRDGVTVTARGPAGLFHGTQALLQLLPPDVFGVSLTAVARSHPSPAGVTPAGSPAPGSPPGDVLSAVTAVVGRPSTSTPSAGASIPGSEHAEPPHPLWRAPCARIVDRPRFPWRGMHLDVSRHFFPKEFVKRYLDILAMHRMNVFHWHLTDDQGWRVPISRYPRLTQVGAWRVDREDRHWLSRDPQREGEAATYGGFYTRDDIGEIVRYAARRNITVVPEIEMPAHAMAALAAHPEYSCSGEPEPVPPGSVWPNTRIFCAGNDAVFEFIENVLDEVLDLFPSRFIHIGGDEADKQEWRRCPKCQARIRAEGLKDESELQSWFVKRIERFLAGRGRRLIGWDEILEGGLAPGAAVMSWRGTEGGIAAARLGHDVVMSPGTHCYFDHYQGNPTHEPPAIGGFTPLAKVYEFEPVPPELGAAESGRVLGGQANVWTEYMPGGSQVEYMILPRMAALAEALWSPKPARDWAGFARRLPVQLARYEARGYGFARGAWHSWEGGVVE